MAKAKSNIFSFSELFERLNVVFTEIRSKSKSAALYPDFLARISTSSDITPDSYLSLLETVVEDFHNALLSPLPQDIIDRLQNISDDYTLQPQYRDIIDIINRIIRLAENPYADVREGDYTEGVVLGVSPQDFSGLLQDISGSNSIF